MNDQATDDQATAELAATTMFERDPASRLLGMRLLAIAPGFARMTMPVRADMINGHRVCHGGYIFMLADSALAFAANARNQAAVAAGASIEFVKPVGEGELLTAEATEQAQAGKSAIYDVRVTDGAGAVVALLRGRAHRLPRPVVEEER